ncbi:MAG: hypothetical protein IJQ21_09325 [Lachnospiraceae bacterium]|nr:hypothetical protein [Lachnospiraceae bacterium]
MENGYGFTNIPRQFTQADIKQIARTRMVRTSMVMAVVALFLFSTGYLSLIPAGVAFITALVSLGADEKPRGNAKAAMILALIAIILSYMTIAYTIYNYVLPAIRNPESATELNAVSEQLYGVSFSDMISQIREQWGMTN